MLCISLKDFTNIVDEIRYMQVKIMMMTTDQYLVLKRIIIITANHYAHFFVTGPPNRELLYHIMITVIHSSQSTRELLYHISQSYGHSSTHKRIAVILNS